MRFLHVADIHLDSPMLNLRRMGDEAHGAHVDCTRRALEKLVEYAIDEANGIDFVVIAGDVFDGTWKDYQTGIYFQSQMRRLRSAGIPVVAIRGNHDAQGKMTRDLTDWRDTVTFLDADACQTLRGSEIGLTDELIIHGQSFRDASVTENLVAEYPEGSRGAFHLGLLHTSLTGDFDGHGNYAPCTLDDLRSKGYGYWALGHIHLRQAMHREGDAALVHFAGNLQGRSVRECGAKGALVVDVDSDYRATCRFQAFDVLRWLRIEVSLAPEDDAEAALARFESLLKKAMQDRQGRELAVRVVFSGRCEAHRKFSKDLDLDRLRADTEQIVADVGQDLVWLEKVKDETRPNYDRGRMASGEGPAAELIRLIDDVSAGRSELNGLTGIDELSAKIRAELRAHEVLDSDEQGMLSPEHLRQLLPRAEAILLGKMQDASSDD
jgi:DNA repair exonuclease SbcCD nuclease subunit